ncbi:hypothetical protein ECTOBSL9_2207 [Ectothiorhodospira sp. BSL-9]|nr:hypothetical protein ECTOBSL9_2207 [Ectothiorhodospira sp. BSL-9]
MGHATLGEITPEYMILPEPGVEKMSNELGRSAKIILISRDPVDRFISAFKLLKVYRGDRYDKERVSEGINEALETMPEWVAQQAALNDYGSAMEKYQKYFDDVLLMSYENMVASPEKTSGILQEFLGLPVDKEKMKDLMGNRVNAIGESGEVPDDLRAVILKAVT